jgi:hypothetical protein
MPTLSEKPIFAPPERFGSPSAYLAYSRGFEAAQNGLKRIYGNLPLNLRKFWAKGYISGLFFSNKKHPKKQRGWTHSNTHPHNRHAVSS